MSTVDVVPYGLYSSKWTDLTDTTSWVNTGIVADEITGQSLPHGGKVVLPAQTDFDFARGLYLLQSAGLVKLDRPFGGSAPADLTITEANVVDSLRHLSLLAQYSTEHYPEIYQQYDAVVLSPEQATAIGLDPATDALAVEPGPGNPFASVLVAPSRLAGDPRVLELTHALESPELARVPGAGAPREDRPGHGCAEPLTGAVSAPDAAPRGLRVGGRRPEASRQPVRRDSSERPIRIGTVTSARRRPRAGRSRAGSGRARPRRRQVLPRRR